MKRDLTFEKVSELELGIFLYGACLEIWNTSYAPTEHAIDKLLNKIEETYGKFTEEERLWIAKEIREFSQK